MLRRTFLLSASTAVAACSTPPSSGPRIPQVSDESPPGNHLGIVLISVTLNDPVPNAIQQPDISVGFTSASITSSSGGVLDLLPGSNLLAVAVPPGVYSWTMLTVYRTFDSLGGKFPFTIRSGATTYAGELLLSVDRRAAKYSFTRGPDSSEKVAQFVKRYPVISSKFPVLQ
jgi:hypothetical protein